VGFFVVAFEAVFESIGHGESILLHNHLPLDHHNTTQDFEVHEPRSIISILFHTYIRATKGKTNFDVPIRYTKFRWSNSFHRKIMFQNRFWTNQSLNSKYSLICQKTQVTSESIMVYIYIYIYINMLYNKTYNIITA